MDYWESYYWETQMGRIRDGNGVKERQDGFFSPLLSVIKVLRYGSKTRGLGNGAVQRSLQGCKIQFAVFGEGHLVNAKCL